MPAIDQPAQLAIEVNTNAHARLEFVNKTSAFPMMDLPPGVSPSLAKSLNLPREPIGQSSAAKMMSQPLQRRATTRGDVSVTRTRHGRLPDTAARCRAQS